MGNGWRGPDRLGNAEDGRKNLAHRLSGWLTLCMIVGSGGGAAAVALALTPVLLALTAAVLALALDGFQPPSRRCPASPRGTDSVPLRHARQQRQPGSRR
jgi:hypothetical protein